MRTVHKTRRQDVALVTDAKRPMSQDIAFRERRYLVMMGIRVACFIITVIVVAEHGGWFAVIPAAGAIVIPYFAVVFANGGREPSNTRGFRIYEPNLPERYSAAQDREDGRSRSATKPSPPASDSDEAASCVPERPEDYGTH